MQNLASKVLNFLGSRLFLYLSLGWFTLQGIFMAVSTNIGIPPDENWHIGVIRLYTKDGVDPFIQHQTSDYFLGNVTHSTSFLYHYLSSLVLRLLDIIGLGGQSLYILRFLNVGLAIVSLVLIWKIFSLLKFPSIVKNLVVFMMSNTLMFVFLSSSINYDNLLMTLSTLSFLLFVQLLQKATIEKTLMFVAVVLLAILTKFTFLPIAAMMVSALVWRQRTYYRHTIINVKKAWSDDRVRLIAISCFLLLPLFVASQLYIGNVVQYKRINPKCDQVLAESQCLQSPIYKRDIDLTQNAANKPALISPDEFGFKWLIYMQDRTFGIFAHRSITPNYIIRLSFITMLAVGLAAVIRMIKWKDREIIILLGIASIYYLLLLKVNWSSYSRHGIFGLALQGRYAFPVIFIFMGVSLNYVWQAIAKNSIIQLAVSLFIIGVFGFSSLPTYISKTDYKWYTEGTQSINTSLNSFVHHF